MLKKMDLPSIAHRGYHVKEVENTLNAFIEAGKRDFIAIETDIYFTLDGYIICHHDPRLKGMNKDIVNCSLSELQSVTLYNKNVKGHVPLFKEYLNACRTYKKIPVIEFKTDLDDKQLDIVIKEVKEEFGDINHCFFISFNRAPLTRMKEKARINKYHYTLFRLGDSKEVVLETLSDNIGLNFNYNFLTKDIVNTFKARNLPVAVWTVDRYADVEKMSDMGVDYIASNIFQCKRKYVREFKL